MPPKEIKELESRLEKSIDLCTEVAKGEADRHPETALVMRGRAAAYREVLTWVWELLPSHFSQEPTGPAGASWCPNCRQDWDGPPPPPDQL